MKQPYIPGKSPPPEIPLGRFLPPVPEGMVSTWCRENLKPGEWVLDPFGFNPLVPIEVASMGHPVLVTVNNPIQAFILKVLASAPQKEELVAAFQGLAIESKGNDRMEPYIRSLYHINCSICRRQIEAESFLWKKGEETPYAVLVECPYCGTKGEQTLNDESLQSITPLPPYQLHLARALNRVAEPNDILRSQVENALTAYPQRPLIILQTIINKLESLEQTQRRRDLLTALILSAADQGNTLWAYPSPRDRPRQIVIPSVFRERNLWKVMEESIEKWQVRQSPIPVTDWDGPPADPVGIYRFTGRVKELKQSVELPRFSAVITAIPRPNQAFWTFSALWTGWIWGREAVAPIRNALARQRYDWNWHAYALNGVFNAIHNLQPDIPVIWGLIAENEPQLLLAALLAGDVAGYQLLHYARSLDDQLAQCTWQPQFDSVDVTLPDVARKIAREKVRSYLQEKGEPASFNQIHAAAVSGLAQESRLAIDILIQNKHQALSEMQKWIETLFKESDVIQRVTPGTSSIETVDWWLTEPKEVHPPLIDRVEEAILRFMIEHQTATAEEIKDVLYQAFPGIYTPQNSVLLNCLESYAGLVDPQTHTWRLRDSEKPSVRQADVNDVKHSLSKIAQKLGYQSKGDDPILWYDGQQEDAQFSFHVFSSAIISRHTDEPEQDARYRILVIPGSRANLVAFKVQRNPVLKNWLQNNYLIVKFRVIRDLEINPLLSRELFLEQIQVDPPEYQSSQLALF